MYDAQNLEYMYGAENVEFKFCLLAPHLYPRCSSQQLPALFLGDLHSELPGKKCHLLLHVCLSQNQLEYRN